MRHLLALALLAAPTRLAAQDLLPFFARHQVIDAAVTPEGSLIAYTVRFADVARDAFTDTVFVVPAKGGAPWTLGPGSHPAFAPKGQGIAWLDRDGRLMVRDSLGGSDRVVSPHDGVESFRWSPDGSRIAYVADGSVPLPQAKEFQVNGRASRHTLYRVEASRGTDGGARPLGEVGFQAGPAERELAGIPEFDWLDEKTLIVSGHEVGGSEPADAASVYAIDVEEGTPRYLAGKGGRWHFPVVSPGREWIAFTGQPVGGVTTAASELLIMKPDGTGIRRLTVGLDRDVLDLAWRNDRELWFATEERGARNIHHLDITKGKVEVGTSGSHLLSLQAISPRGAFALAVRSTPTIAGELVRFPLERPASFTTVVSPDAPPTIGEIEEFDFRNPSGLALSAWLVRPTGFDPSKRYPLLVDVHGGPHAMAGFGYAPDALALASLGWLVLRVNPRGSTGYGFDIRNGLDRRWPGNDVLDLRAAIADVVSRGLADSTRIAVRGTGGGAVTAVALRHDEPLVGAAVLRCAGDGWLSSGRGIDPSPWHDWGSSRPFQGFVLDWLPQSPLAGVADNAKPVLVIDGRPTGPQLLDFGGMVHDLLRRTGKPSAYLRLDAACDAAGPVTQARLARTESDWLDRAWQ